MDLRNLNVVGIEDIDAVLVSTFQELYGLPYLIKDRSSFYYSSSDGGPQVNDFPSFKGKIYMT